MHRRHAALRSLFLASALTCGGALSAGAADAGGGQAPAPGAPAQSVAGTYRYQTYRAGREGYDNELVVKDAGGGRLHISLSGSYIYRANGAETMKEGGGEGTAALKGTVATASLTPDGGGEPCRVDITFGGGRAVVKAADDCGFNIVLDGAYLKAGAAPPPAPAGKRTGGGAAAPREVAYAGLADFVNDLEGNKAGRKYVVTSVPIEKIERVLREGRAGAVPGHRGLFQLGAEGEEGGVASGFVTSAALVKSLLANAEHEPASLRVTATLVEFTGAFDFYRTSFVTKIEGLNDDGSVMWTAAGPPPTLVRYRQ